MSQFDSDNLAGFIEGIISSVTRGVSERFDDIKADMNQLSIKSNDFMTLKQNLDRKKEKLEDCVGKEASSQNFENMSKIMADLASQDLNSQQYIDFHKLTAGGKPVAKQVGYLGLSDDQNSILQNSKRLDNFLKKEITKSVKEVLKNIMK